MDRIHSFLVFLIAFVHISAATEKGTDPVLFDGATADDEDEFETSGEEVIPTAAADDLDYVEVLSDATDAENDSQGFNCAILAMIGVQCPTEDLNTDSTSPSTAKPESPASVDATNVVHRLTDSPPARADSTPAQAASTYLNDTIITTGAAAQLTMSTSAAVDSEVIRQTSRHASTISENADTKPSIKYVTSPGIIEDDVERVQSTTPNVAIANERAHTSSSNAFDLGGEETDRPHSTSKDFDTSQTPRIDSFDVDVRAFPERTHLDTAEDRTATTTANTASRLSSITSGLIAAIVTSNYSTEASQEDRRIAFSQDTTILADHDERMASTMVANRHDVNRATSASDGDPSTNSDVDGGQATAKVHFPATTGSFEDGNPMTSTTHLKLVSSSSLTTRGEEILFGRAPFPITIVIVCVIAALLALAIILVLAVIIRGRLNRSGKYDISSEVNSIIGTESGSPNGAKVVTVQYNDTKA